MALSIPCDLCDVKLQQNAVKSCRECNLSYCIYCVIHHPQTGVLAKHSLVDSKEFMRKKRFVCLKCYIILERDDNHGDVLQNCRIHHRSEVMDVEEAKVKVKNKMLGEFTKLKDRRKKYEEAINKTTESLNDLMANADARKTDLQELCYDRLKGIITDYKQIKRSRLQEIQSAYESRVRAVEDKGQRYLGKLKDASNHLRVLVPDIKYMLEKQERDLDFKKLVGLYSRVQQMVAKEMVPDCKLVPPEFDVSKKIEELYPSGPPIKKMKIDAGNQSPSIHEQKKNSPSIHEQKKNKVPPVAVKIQQCTCHPMKEGKSAFITLKWDYPSLEVPKEAFTYQAKFVEVDKIAGAPSHELIVRNIISPWSSCQLRQFLQPYLTYSVTVMLQGKPETESESMIVHTLPDVRCEPFLLIKLQKLDVTRQERKDKQPASDQDRSDSNKTLTKGSGKFGNVAAGTLLLTNQSIYWEVEVSYHLRNVPSNCTVLCVGICADNKLHASPNFGEVCPSLYGVAIGKDEDSGTPAILSVVEGTLCSTYPIKQTEKNYTNRFGFFYDADHHSLAIVDLKDDRIILKAQKLKHTRGVIYEYRPIFKIRSEKGGYASIKVLTGTDITSIPQCLVEFLK